MKFKYKSTVLACLLSCAAFVPSQSFAGEETKLKMPAWNQFEYGQHSLDIHGYFRTSKGWDSEGGDIMPVFIAPGAQSRFRLGNESDTNIEVGLDYKYYLDGVGLENSRFVQLYGMISDYDSNPDYADSELRFEEKSNPQSYIRLGNIVGDGVNVWAGRRYYDRRDIHMIDHFWINVAQGAEVGGGIEGIKLGAGTLDVAAFKNEDDEVAHLAGGGVRHDLDTYTLDLRYRGIDTFENGDLTLWGLYAHRPEKDNIAFDQESGFALGGWHTQRDLFTKGRMVTGFAYRENIALQQGLFNSLSVREDQGYDLDEAFSFEINNDWLIEPSENWAMQWATVLRHEDRGQDGTGGGDTIDWASTGIRPVYFLNDYVSIATELGVDYVDNELINREGFLGKGTVALQLTQERGYFARPMIKLFATGASWSDDFRGLVGSGNPSKANNFADDTSGVTFGIQFEVWW